MRGSDSSFLYNQQMSATGPQTASRRPRLLWTLLGAMVLVGLLPLVVSHYFLIGINRDSLETLEKKYLTRSAVSIAADIQNLISSNTEQLSNIANSVRVVRHTLPPDVDAFGYIGRRDVISDYLTSDPDLIGLRILNPAGQGAEAIPAGLDRSVIEDLDLYRTAALKGQNVTGRFLYVSVVNQPAVVVAVPVTDGGQVIGVVEGLISLRQITDRLREE